MSNSIRIWRDCECDLRIEEIAQGDCRLQIEAKPACDDQICIALTIEGWGMSADGERRVYDTVDEAAAAEKVAEDDRDVVGVWQEVWLASRFFAHGNPLQQMVTEFNRLAGQFNELQVSEDVFPLMARKESSEAAYPAGGCC